MSKRSLITFGWRTTAFDPFDYARVCAYILLLFLLRYIPQRKSFAWLHFARVSIYIPLYPLKILNFVNANHRIFFVNNFLARAVAPDSLAKFTTITTTTTIIIISSIASITIKYTHTRERVRPGKMHRAHLRSYRRTDIGI